MENLIRRICISYELNKEDRIEYLFLSEFFKTIGLFIYEDVRDETKTDYNKIDYPIIVIGNVDIDNENVIKYDSIREKYDDKKAKLKELTKILDIKDIDILIDIYVNYNVMNYFLNMSFYPKTRKQIFWENDNNHMAIINILSKYKNTNKNNLNRYVDYAYLYYLVKEDIYCVLNKYIPEYHLDNLDKLFDEMNKLYEEYKPNITGLKSLVYSEFFINHSDRGASDANGVWHDVYAYDVIRCLEDTLKTEKDQLYSSDIYYLYGAVLHRSWPKMRSKEIINYYEKSNKYNNVSKLITFYRDVKSDYEKIMEICYNYLDSLTEKTEKKVLLPIEIISIFKIYFDIMQYNLSKPGLVISYGNKYLNFLNDFDKVGVYDELYGEEKEKYINLTRKNREWSYRALHKMLSRAYDECKEHELANKHYNLFLYYHDRH